MFFDIQIVKGAKSNIFTCKSCAWVIFIILFTRLLGDNSNFLTCKPRKGAKSNTSTCQLCDCTSPADWLFTCNNSNSNVWRPVKLSELKTVSLSRITRENLVNYDDATNYYDKNPDISHSHLSTAIPYFAQKKVYSLDEKGRFIILGYTEAFKLAHAHYTCLCFFSTDEKMYKMSVKHL